MLHSVTAWMRSRGKAVKPVAATLVALVMVFATALGAHTEAGAAERTMTLTADPTTFTQWTEGVGDPVNPSSTGRVWTDKSVSTGDVTLDTYDGRTVTVPNAADDEFLVGLSAMSSAQEIRGVTGGGAPLDVTLVLDVSGSMASAMNTQYTPIYADFHNKDLYVEDPEQPGEYKDIYYRGDDYYYYDSHGDQVHVVPKNAADDDAADHVQLYSGEHVSRLDALKQSVNGFLDLMAQRNAGISGEELKNRAGIITYSTDTQIDSPFTSDTARLAAAVNGLSDHGGTYAGKGLELAQQLIAQEKRADADSVVIFFTDGEAFDRNLAMQKANELKAAGTTIYSVGVFKGADANDMDRVGNKFMQGISSNYPKAVITGAGDWLMGERAADGDHYMTANDSGQLRNIFNDIWTAISSKPTSPIESTTSASGVERGAVTFTDTLGDYMAVRDFKAVLFAGVMFEQKSVTTDGDTTTVVFDGDVEGNPIYGGATLADLRISVKHAGGAAGDVITVTVPEQLLPLRLYTADVDRDGGVTTDIRRTHPIRVFYTVGLKDGVRDGLDAPDDGLAQYVAANSGADGAVDFTSHPNAETGTTTATFTPAKSNAFYYFTEDTPLYASKSTADPAKTLEPDGTYYYRRTYYADNAAHEQWVAVSGAAADGKVAQDPDGNWYGKAGSARLALANYARPKTENTTGTAVMAIAPHWDGAAVSVALGNNGRMRFQTVAAALPGEAAPSAEGPQDAQVSVEVPDTPVQQATPATTGATIVTVVLVALVTLATGAALLILARRRS